MLLRTDYTSHIGEQHRKTGKPNQDYVQSGTLSDNAVYAIVSDGCSSGGLTDIGSRLIVLATKRAIEEVERGADWLQSCNTVTEVNRLRDRYLELYRESLKLEHRDLLATCLWALCDKGSVLVHVTGDGVIGVQYKNNLTMHHFAWNQNTPYYPAYRQGGLDEQFMNAHASSALPLTYTNDDTVSPLSVLEGMEGQIIRLDHSDENTGNEPLSIALFSDGVEHVDGFSYKEVVAELMSFKSTSGQFAVRRMNRFLKEATDTGKGPMDDISYAVIHLDQIET